MNLARALVGMPGSVVLRLGVGVPGWVGRSIFENDGK